MAASLDDRKFRQRMERIEALLREAEQVADPTARDRTREIVQIVLDLHGAGLERMLEHIAESRDDGVKLIGSLAKDDLVGSLLLLYGLHPLDTEARVRQALDKVRPSLRSHGGSVELLGIVGGVVRLRMEGSCDGCPSSAATLKQSIEQAIFDKAPEVTSIEVEADRATEALVANGASRFALPLLRG